ncbi:hypothetical protein DICVIV_11604 [Dictyocaulus viviparus]|uniref:Uncharacterized protein n=1 Tax=Dictyocaulus viviparus TaxID=29172 RepID=A0A0D8XFD8_DICVI|nr:hypothetical protein DICVIV_11604 [Dictyocaulus viviparus]
MNVPPYIITQLEKANDVIRKQSEELDRFRSSGLQMENLALRTQLMEIAEQYRNNRDIFFDQEAVISELNHELKSLARDKEILQERYIELERKYKKAKAANKEFEKLVDMVESCSSKATESLSLVDRSRKKHISLSENIDGIFDESLQVLERDEEINELNCKLRSAELLRKQADEDLSRTSTDLALERARCDELTLSLQESEGLLSQTRSDCLEYALENQRLLEEIRDVNQLIVSYRAKLDAQGADLIATKKSLRALQREKCVPVSNAIMGTNELK